MLRGAFHGRVTWFALAMMLPTAASAALPSGGPITVAGIVLAATLTVKLVIALLVLVSIASWAMLVAKIVQLRAAFRTVEKAHSTIRQAPLLEDLPALPDRAVAYLVEAARDEIGHSRSVGVAGTGGGVTERVALILSRSEAHLARRIGAGVGFFATAGSVTPFIGLFGTVWGIMHSFMGIAEANSTSLAVVAPGIAEALLATAIGLIVAIPATIMYNVVGKMVGNYRSRLADCSAAIICLVSRDAERQPRHLAAVPARAGA